MTALPTNTCLIGDVRAVLPTLPTGSVSCCVTSPPYWALRSYLPEGSPLKPLELGQEENPDAWVAVMVEVFREVRRVLTPDGTLWLNVGDKYASAPGGNMGKNSRRAGRTFTARITTAARRVGLKDKDMIGLPWMLAFALRADGWWLRSEVIWSKTNPQPESVEDRPTKTHEHLFLLSKSPSYHYDAAAIREPASGTAHARGRGVNPKAAKANRNEVRQNASFSAAVRGLVDERNARTVWTIPTEPYHGAHFACFPRQLAQRCILAGCPPGGVVLDPFFGSGTTGQVAEALGRKWLGVELNPDYEPLWRGRTAQQGLAFGSAQGGGG